MYPFSRSISIIFKSASSHASNNAFDPNFCLVKWIQNLVTKFTCSKMCSPESNFSEIMFMHDFSWPFRAPASPPIIHIKHQTFKWFFSTVQCIGGFPLKTFPNMFVEIPISVFLILLWFWRYQPEAILAVNKANPKGIMYNSNIVVGLSNGKQILIFCTSSSLEYDMLNQDSDELMNI